jgi:hypothetical protein
MALKGNLRDFTITQLLNLINLAHKTGTLIVEGPEKVFVSAFEMGSWLMPRPGKKITAWWHPVSGRNKLNAASTGQLKNAPANMSDKELGLLLINANYINQQDILTSLQLHFHQVVNRLFTWVEGLFRFENDVLPPDDKITVRINLENIIIEGSRRLREWEQLQDEIPSLDMALKFTDRPGHKSAQCNLSVENGGWCRTSIPRTPSGRLLPLPK